MHTNNLHTNILRSLPFLELVLVKRVLKTRYYSASHLELKTSGNYSNVHILRQGVQNPSSSRSVHVWDFNVGNA